MENDLGPGKSWNLLGNDADDSFWLQVDMFLQTKVATIVTTRYTICGAGMPKMFLWPGDFAPDFAGGAYNAAGCHYIKTLLAYDRVLEKCFWGPGKVLEVFVTKRMGTVSRHLTLNTDIDNVVCAAIADDDW